MDSATIQRTALRDELLRTIRREAINRLYGQFLASDRERQTLQDRVRKINLALGL